jgi:hypothetical protein
MSRTAKPIIFRVDPQLLRRAADDLERLGSAQVSVEKNYQPKSISFHVLTRRAKATPTQSQAGD